MSEVPSLKPILDALCARLVDIYLSQPSAGRAALLGFLHTSADAREIRVRFCTRRSGSIALLLEALDDGYAEPELATPDLG